MIFEETSIDEFSRKYFDFELMQGESKVKTIDEAIREHIKPKMHIYSGYLPFGLTNEIMRQFSKLNSVFTISCLGAVDNIVIMATAGLVERVIASYAGLILPSPILSGALQQAISDGLVIENWSLLTIIQRLQAAALNLPFMPTNSLRGSSIADENERKGLYKKITDPFSLKEIGALRPLKPDIAVMHAYCADASGNAIPVLPSTERAYGAFASKEGVILSVEKIVSTEFIRKNASNVAFPASIVKCVVKAPFGMHPYGCRGYDGYGYGEDVQFAKNLQVAFREVETAKEWINEWIFSTKSHDDYLNKLTPNRLRTLRTRASHEDWKNDVLKMTRKLSNTPANKKEKAVIFAAREVIESIQTQKCNTILAGIGISHLAAWIAAYILHSNKVDVHLIVELGLFGYFPPPTQPFLISIRGLESCLMLTDTINILGLVANNTQVLACISGGQIDKQGNINSTKVGDFFLFGSGGANDISTTAKEVIVTVLQDERRLVEQVPYVTCPGVKVRKVVTDRAVFERIDDELVLKKIFVDVGENNEKALLTVKNNMGWDPKISEILQRLNQPKAEEIMMLRYFDPNEYFIGEH